MPTPSTPNPDDLPDCVEQLRLALAANGIKLPSLGLDLPTFADRFCEPYLVTLGNCNTTTARALTAALRKAADR